MTNEIKTQLLKAKREINKTIALLNKHIVETSDGVVDQYNSDIYIYSCDNCHEGFQALDQADGHDCEKIEDSCDNCGNKTYYIPSDW